MADEIETLDSLNEETIESDEGSADALKEKLQKLEEVNRQLFARAKKAEGFEQNEKGDWIKEELKSSKPEKSGKIDYGKLAFLESKGIKNSDDVAYVEREADATGKPLYEVLGFKYVQEYLKDAEDSRKNAEAGGILPKRSGSPARDTVEYHLAKETPLLQIQDQELRRKVLNTRIAKETSASKFSDKPIIQ